MQLQLLLSYNCYFYKKKATQNTVRLKCSLRIKTQSPLIPLVPLVPRSVLTVTVQTKKTISAYPKTLPRKNQTICDLYLFIPTLVGTLCLQTYVSH